MKRSVPYQELALAVIVVAATVLLYTWPVGVAHWIGLLGEASNLLGTFILSFDLLYRKKEHENLRNYQSLSAWAEQHGLEVRYKELRARDPEFATFILAREAGQLALNGLRFLIVGFILLGLYHWIEIFYTS